MSDISTEVDSISQKVASVQLLLLSEGNSSSFCPLYISELHSIDGEIERIGYKLTYLEEERGAVDNDLKKRYFTLEAESYLLSKKVQGLCGDESILLIHFYSNKGCEKCREQGSEILKARDALSEEGIYVKLFSFDGEIGSPVAQAFQAQYNVSSYPSVVINGETYPGFRTELQLQSYIRAAR